MKSFNQKTKVSFRKPSLQNIERIHPFKMINYLIISISCLLYAFITFLLIKYLVGDLQGIFKYEIPKFFVVSTIFLIVSTHFSSRIIKAYETDAIKKLKKLLSYTLIFGFLYFLSQSLAWMELLKLDLVYDIS